QTAYRHTFPASWHTSPTRQQGSVLLRVETSFASAAGWCVNLLNVLQRDPRRPALARLYRLLNETHAAQSVVDGREIIFVGTQRLAVDLPANRPDDAVIDRRKCFQVAFGVAGRQARGRLGRLRKITLAAGQHLARLAIAVHAQLVRVFLGPTH